MNESAVAATVLSRTGRMGAGISAALMKQALGEDGYRYALEKRWLVPDMDNTGELAINHNLNVLRAIREAAANQTPAIETAPRPQIFPGIFGTSKVYKQVHEDDMSVEVGTPVVIADNGKTFQATVKTRHGDGSYELSFGADKPANADRRYRKEELGDQKTAGQPKAVTPLPTVGAPAGSPRAGSPAVA